VEVRSATPSVTRYRSEAAVGGGIWFNVVVGEGRGPAGNGNEREDVHRGQLAGSGE